MTRFIFLSDTHFGTDGSGFHQQTVHSHRLPEIVEALERWIEKDAAVDFILHGGDLIHDGSLEQIQAAERIFRWPVPVYLCLGNHDLKKRESLSHWLTAGARFFPEARPEFLLETEDCAIHVRPNHWGEADYFWEDVHRPRLSPEQWVTWERDYEACRGRVQIFLTHSPVFGLPPEQTGLGELFHAPPEEFTRSVQEAVKNHPDLLCVLGGHNHLNMQVCDSGIHFVTASSLIEAPFEFKVFECRGNHLSMETIALGPDLGFETHYDATKSFVQGGKGVRNFSAQRPGAAGEGNR